MDPKRLVGCLLLAASIFASRSEAIGADCRGEVVEAASPPELTIEVKRKSAKLRLRGIAEKKNKFKAQNSGVLGSGGAELQTGDYLAYVIPPHRNGAIFPHEASLDTGVDGALILFPRGRAFDCLSPMDVVVIHAGKQWNPAFRALRVSPDDMNWILGTITHARRVTMETGFPGQLTRWDQPGVLMRPNDRLKMFLPLAVHVDAKQQPKPPRKGRGVQARLGQNAELLDTAGLDAIYATAGQASVDYIADWPWLSDALGKLRSRLDALINTSKDDFELASRVSQLTEDDRKLLVRAGQYAEGLEFELRNNPGFSGSNAGLAMLLDDIEQKRERASELYRVIKESGSTASPGDIGGAWLVPDIRSAVKSECLAPVTVPVAFDHDDWPGKKMHANATVWFNESQNLPGSYLMEVQLNADAEPMRLLHRTRASELLATTVSDSCSRRTRLRETDEYVLPDGTIETKANVRITNYICATITYPCGVSIHGTKSCDRTAKTEIATITFPAYNKVAVSGSESTIAVNAAGESISIDLKAVPGFNLAFGLAGLKVEPRPRFARADGHLGLAARMHGDQSIYYSVACGLANEIREHQNDAHP
jgi:hypothetical protein